MIIQFLVAMVATASFSILFCAPYGQLILCAVTGALGWISYLALVALGTGPVVASLIATFILTIISRALSSIRKNPVTIYLVTGIFPLVPGAGIYYTSYHLIMNQTDLFAAKGMETFKIAGAIAIGIIFGFSLPQSIFNRLQRSQKI